MRHQPSAPSLFRILLVLLAAATPAPAGDGPASRIEDKRLGEEQQILKRQEWFYSSRRAGAASDTDLWKLRLDAVEQTRRDLAAQRARRSRGQERSQNFWISKGPSPSSFGSWAFGNVSGRIQAITADWASGTLYVGAASGGVWKSTNDGLSWTSVFDSAGTTAVGAITVDPNDPNVLWVGTGDNVSSCESYFGIGLLRSPDGGATWELRNGSGSNTLEGLASFANVLVDPRDSNHIVTGGRYRGCSGGAQQSAGIYTTDDGGLNWTNRLSNTQVHELAQDPSVLDVFWAATDSGIYKSVNNGVNWVLQTASGLPSGSVGRTELAIAPSDSNTVYALFSSPALWRTTDGGASWQQMSSGGSACDGQCWYNMTIRVSPTDANTVYRGTVHVFKSTNGGSNWSDLSNNWGSSQTVHQDTHALLMDPADSDTFYVSGDGGIWKSENGGSSFTNLNGNLNITQFYAVGVDDGDTERICGGAQDNSSLARSNSDVWSRQAVTGDGFVCFINSQNTSYNYITSYPSGGFPNVWRSTNGLFGSFFDISGANSGIVNGDRSNWVTPYLLDPVTPSTLYLGTHRVYRSDDNGSTWVLPWTGDLTGGGTLRALEINRTFPTHLFSGSTDGKVWRTTDSATTWTDITSGLPSRSINDIGADPTNPDRAFAVVGGFNTAHLWEWNLATGWTARDGGLPNVPANTVILLSDVEVIVGNDVGVFRSIDGGQSFTPFMDGLPEGLPVTDFKYSEQALVLTAGTYGRGAWQVSAGALIPILLIDSVEQPLVEVDGDGDGNLEPGETWSVRPILKNAGGEAATGAGARLSTSTPGVTILDAESMPYGDVPPGATAPVQSAYRFVVDPAFDCGTEIVFDLLDVSSANEPQSHADQLGIFTVPVIDSYGASIPEQPVNESFDPAPAGWSHEDIDFAASGCSSPTNNDDWNLASKDAAHGTSYHCGTGPGGNYSRTNHAWLYLAGKDSDGGPGVMIPDDAVGATLTIEHWYDTADGLDGGQVVIDANENGQDVFTTLEPAGGYPGGTLATGRCNALEGKKAFQGSSGGWVTSTFDLVSYKGNRVYLAFVFGSDRSGTTGEGWYVDDVRIDFQRLGPPVCDLSLWPGRVASSQFNLTAPDTIEATWDDSCNVGDVPAQTYSIQVGDLDVLHGSQTYTHAPLGDLCDRTSTTTFTPGSGNEYYLIVPFTDGREGDAGTDSAGTDRPQTSSVCGVRRVECP